MQTRFFGGRERDMTFRGFKKILNPWWLNRRGKIIGGWVEVDRWLQNFCSHHDLCFFMVDAHTASFCPVLAGVYHRLKLRWGSGYENHVIDIQEGSNPVEVIN